MAVLLQPLTDSSGFTHGAILAGSRGAKYIWAPDVEPWFDGNARIKSLTGPSQRKRERGTDPQAWLSMAQFGIGSEYLANAPVTEHESTSAAVDAAGLLFLNNKALEPTSLTVADNAAMDDFAASGADPEDPQAVLSLVTSLLGPIDPEGPNGWLLKAAAGEEYDKADAWIRWRPEETGAENGTTEA